MRIMPLIAMLPLFFTQVIANAKDHSPNPEYQMNYGAIVRGPVNEHKIAIVFTGHEYAEEGPAILDALEQHHGKASFFLTGVFLTNPKFAPLIHRMIADGDYIGPHSDKHLLFCDWDKAHTTLVTHDQFINDISANLKKIVKHGIPRDQIRYILPAYEQPNQQIGDWSKEIGLTMINYTPGTRSNADYMANDDKHFVPSEKIYDSIIKKEQDDPHGLNGFILLLHVGAGPGRTDKFSPYFAKLLDYLANKNYQFVRVDELLAPSR